MIVIYVGSCGIFSNRGDIADLDGEIHAGAKMFIEGTRNVSPSGLRMDDFAQNRDGSGMPDSNGRIRMF